MTVTIRIKSNRNGKLVAHYWGMARRWLPISVAEAQMAVATGTWKKCNVHLQEG
ncbi:hypothetical protein ACFPOB_29590 [Bosea eneae]|uniref:Uncharacterized protein n=1 Tax=Bosea eneae TaxID=151454 RepID=A0ABW0J1N0_9HYPH